MREWRLQILADEGGGSFFCSCEYLHLLFLNISFQTSQKLLVPLEDVQYVDEINYKGFKCIKIVMKDQREQLILRAEVCILLHCSVRDKRSCPANFSARFRVEWSGKTCKIQTSGIKRKMVKKQEKVRGKQFSPAIIDNVSAYS